MNKNYLKFFVIILLIILTSSPIISSINVINKENDDQINSKEYITPKIEEIINKVNKSTLKKYMIDLLSISPRKTSTYGCKKAAEYIYNEFSEMGLETKYHKWSRFGNIWHRNYFKSKNIIATIPGTGELSNEVIIFNAHYDTVKSSPGANDDGSGTVAVLMAAYALSQYKFNRTIKLITFSGEEIGLRGSQTYVKYAYENDLDVLVEFNADMIGRATSEKTGKKIGLSITEDVEWIPPIFENISRNINLNFNIDFGRINRFERGYSDYASFAKYGYETVACWQGEGDPNMHKPTDTIDNVNFSYLTNYTKHIVAIISYLADFTNPNPQIKIANPKRGILYDEDRTLYVLKDHQTVIFDDVLIHTEVKKGISPIDRVEFFCDGKLIHTDYNVPYQYRLNKFSMRRHEIKTVVYDENDNSASDTMRFVHINFKL